MDVFAELEGVLMGQYGVTRESIDLHYAAYGKSLKTLQKLFEAVQKDREYKKIEEEEKRKREEYYKKLEEENKKNKENLLHLVLTIKIDVL